MAGSECVKRDDNKVPSDWMITELIKAWKKVMITHAKVLSCH